MNHGKLLLKLEGVGKCIFSTYVILTIIPTLLILFGGDNFDMRIVLGMFTPVIIIAWLTLYGFISCITGLIPRYDEGVDPKEKTRLIIGRAILALFLGAILFGCTFLLIGFDLFYIPFFKMADFHSS